MLIPKKVKHRKWQSTRRNPDKVKVETRGTTLAFGSFGIKSLDYARITSNQIEAARKAMSRAIKKTGKIWIRIFPDRPFTSKPPEVPMGKGKGDPEGYCFEVYAGRMLFEIDGVDDATALESLARASDKLPVRTKIVRRG
ncbi:MAG: 50S ribosomal protein L16 [Candidatus Vogelbacteria bacterium]|nr:50S ribosomal protein L16 [Candidatus Vogelbacteria bacterium]